MILVLPFQWAIEAIVSRTAFPVGGIVFPSAVGIGRENVPVMTPSRLSNRRSKS